MGLRKTRGVSVIDMQMGPVNGKESTDFPVDDFVKSLSLRNSSGICRVPPSTSQDRHVGENRKVTDREEKRAASHMMLLPYGRDPWGIKSQP